MTDEARLARLLALRERIEREIKQVESRIDSTVRRRRPRRERAKCGTDGGYYRHLRTTHTHPCEDCKAAHRVAERVRRIQRRALMEAQECA